MSSSVVYVELPRWSGYYRLDGFLCGDWKSAVYRSDEVKWACCRTALPPMEERYSHPDFDIREARREAARRELIEFLRKETA
jgi:hypothetical protein